MRGDFVTYDIMAYFMCPESRLYNIVKSLLYWSRYKPLKFSGYVTIWKLSFIYLDNWYKPPGRG